MPLLLHQGELLRLREPQKWILRPILGLVGYTPVSAGYHPYIHIWVRGVYQRNPGYTLLDPKLAVESISEVPGASKAHRDVVNRAVLYNHLPELVAALTEISHRKFACSAATRVA